MSAMIALFEKFIAKHDLEISTDDLDGLCKQVLVMMYDNAKEVPSATKEKSEKLEDPSKAEERDDLRNCTKEVLNAFCKENGLRVGGTKKEVMDRAWRFLQDESDEDDISPRAKAKEKKEKKVVKKDCCGKTAKGTPCQVNGDEIINGKCYCWRHAKDITSSSKASSKADSESDEEEPEPEPVKPKKKKVVKKKEEIEVAEDDEE
jgi:hypothetical protein